MTIESLPGPGRLPMVVNGRNFPAIVEKDPGSSSRKGGDVDESSPTRISRTEMVARVLLTGNHLVSICGESVACDKETDAGASKILELLERKRDEFGDEESLDVVMRCYEQQPASTKSKKSHKRKRASDAQPHISWTIQDFEESAVPFGWRVPIRLKSCTR